MAHQSPDDIFDVVNERDEVIGRATRREIHARGLLHRAAHIFVFNSRGELFIQKRSMSKDRNAGKFDSSAAGHLDAGEDYDSCAERELREELNLAAPVKRVLKVAACAETDWEHVWLYECHTDAVIQPNADEIESGEFWSLETVEKLTAEQPRLFAPSFIKLFFAWRKHRLS
jgi:isopentenyldiphosphate isomerase